MKLRIIDKSEKSKNIFNRENVKMKNELSDTVRQQYIEDIKKDGEGRIFYVSIACVAAYLVFMRSIDAPGGWWIVVWSIVGFLLVGITANFVELIKTRSEKKLSEINDEALHEMFHKVSQKTQSRKSRKQFSFMLFVGLVVTLIWTNPEIQNVENQINATGRTIFLENNFKNFHIFSYYFEKIESTDSEILYLGAFDRILLVLPNKLLDSWGL